MNKLNQVLVSVALITAVVLGIAVSGFWVYAKILDNNYKVFNKTTERCFDNDVGENNLDFCVKVYENFLIGSKKYKDYLPPQK